MVKVRFDPQKWAQRAANASQDYAEGTQQPRVSWSEAASAANENYVQAVQEAAARGRYERGVQRAGDEKWRRGVQEKGRQRYASGVAVSADEYRRGFEPFRQVLESVQLPPRGPKGQNYERVRAVGEALRQAKQQG